MRRVASLRCGNLRSFTPSKLAQVILARLATLASCIVLFGFEQRKEMTEKKGEWEMIKQIAVFLENKEGKASACCQVLKDAGVNL